MKQLFFKVIFSSLAMLAFIPAWAADETDNVVCDAKTYDYQGVQVLLNLDKKKADQQLYFLQNMDDRPLIVDHIPARGSASAGWGTTIDPHHWSVLSLNRKEMTFQCSMEKENDISMKRVLCENVLKVCRALYPIFKEGTAGSYWVTENQVNFDAAFAQTKQRGIQMAALPDDQIQNNAKRRDQDQDDERESMKSFRSRQQIQQQQFPQQQPQQEEQPHGGED